MGSITARGRVHRPLLAFALAVAAAAPLAAAADGVLMPRMATPDVTRTLFHDEWRVPVLRVSEDDEEPPLHVDLAREMKALASATFPLDSGDGRLAWSRSFGDMVQALHAQKDDDARRRMLRELRDARPDVWKRVGLYVASLTLEDRLHGGEWEADDDQKDDGLLLVEPFDRAASGDPYWSKLGGTRDMHQAAALFYADLEAIKAAENDFATYPQNVGADYEFIHAVEGGYLRTADASGRVTTVVRMVFQTDLPFPYGTFDCDVRIRTSLDDDGLLTTDVYSPSPDVYWLGGQDVSIPVRASDGTWVAMLHARVYGFDIRSVPDGDGARHSAILGSLGNLKLRAERRFRDYGGPPRTISGAVPEFVVRGVGPAPEDEDD